MIKKVARFKLFGLVAGRILMVVVVCV